VTPSEIIERLARQAPVLRALGESFAPEEALYKPSPDAWSALEVVNHLLDEERDDFRTRLDLTLHRPETEWPGIDPVGWVQSRNYAGREFGPSLEALSREREASLRWLRGLADPRWEQAHQHPRFGPIRAGDLLVSWAEHDLLHLRQLLRLKHLDLQQRVAPFTTLYAGEW
jgi:hypothetical protein